MPALARRDLTIPLLMLLFHVWASMTGFRQAMSGPGIGDCWSNAESRFIGNAGRSEVYPACPVGSLLSYWGETYLSFLFNWGVDLSPLEGPAECGIAR